ncbi:protein adenylyltransferase SelO [Romboutsia sp.]|uniref:protein adenylyltransferase SelO n=1 Tax=Romboutsia sp. TaxID=1965302 RepID=UPI003F2B3C5E
MKLNLDNTYTSLPDEFYNKIELSPVKSPNLVILNESLADSLGIDANILKTQEGVEILSGNKKTKNGAYIAQAYAGHQFGHFTMLGDGRALLIGEIITPNRNRYDIQLKGSGQTPYSRRGDGRAALSPMLREYIISEAMYALGVPTTRSLAVVKTGEKVYREDVKQGAILTRIASSHIRFGTFEYARRLCSDVALKELADYTINRHFKNIIDNENKYINLLKEVIKLHANLVAKWQSIGFIHGVMNTDNMTISGETIDYGPCAFMDNYNADTVFSSIDHSGRYSYKNQPTMAHWNLCRFAETLLPLIDENTDLALEKAQEAIYSFTSLYNKNWIDMMKSKLGIFHHEDNDKSIIEDLLNIIQKYNEDYTNTFVALTLNKIDSSKMFNSNEFNNWYKIWQDRLKRQENSKKEVFTLMKKSNPAVIPRNHRVEEALEASEKGDFTIMEKLLYVLKNPYEYSTEQEIYSTLSKYNNSCYKTFCGT